MSSRASARPPGTASCRAGTPTRLRPGEILRTLHRIACLPACPPASSRPGPRWCATPSWSANRNFNAVGGTLTLDLPALAGARIGTSAFATSRTSAPRPPASHRPTALSRPGSSCPARNLLADLAGVSRPGLYLGCIRNFLNHFREPGAGENWTALPEFFKDHGYWATGNLFSPFFFQVIQTVSTRVPYESDR